MAIRAPEHGLVTAPSAGNGRDGFHGGSLWLRGRGSPVVCLNVAEGAHPSSDSSTTWKVSMTVTYRIPQQTRGKEHPEK